MTSTKPLYTPENRKSSFQLEWSIDLFWRSPIVEFPPLKELHEACLKDGVKVLELRIVPDISGGDCLASLAQLRLA